MQILTKYKTWIQSNNKTEHEVEVQRELAKTYLEWGLSMQAQQQFADAKSKLDIAASTDPEPASPTGPAALVKANETKLQSEWGDYLIEQKDYAGAITHYENAIAAGQDPTSMQDALANAQVQWALGLSKKEDFLGALQKLEDIEKQSTTDSVKGAVEEARQKVYLAFSKSSGAQAQKAMKDAAAVVCKYSRQPDLPIFGLDKDNVLAVVYGIDERLPKNVAATTPGEMHYVVCIDEVNSRIIEHVIHYSVQMFRIKDSWKVSLRRSDTGKLVENKTFEGQDPPPLPTTGYDIYYSGSFQRYVGVPDIAELAVWLKAFLK